MKYDVELAPAAERELAKLPRSDQSRIISALEKLGEEPHPKGSKKLKGIQNCYRIRVGNYRIVYQVGAKELIVLVIKIGTREDIYRRFRRG